jgi:dTDP-4-amino-4,6-dideoxygalactose transaminase
LGKLAITGGEPLRTKPFTQWPMATQAEADALLDVLHGTGWGGQPFPGKHAAAFAKKFAEMHTAKYAQCVNTGTVAIQAALTAIGIRSRVHVGRHRGPGASRERRSRFR